MNFFFLLLLLRLCHVFSFVACQSGPGISKVGLFLGIWCLVVVAGNLFFTKSVKKTYAILPKIIHGCIVKSQNLELENPSLARE